MCVLLGHALLLALSLRALGRVLAYLVIPPLAWAAAALVENSLGNWL